jgi:uncharacterized protein YegP (UPF0339 family)
MAEVIATKVEVYLSVDGWRFRVKAANGEVIAVGEAYADKRDCYAAVAALTPHIEPVEV